MFVGELYIYFVYPYQKEDFLQISAITTILPNKLNITYRIQIHPQNVQLLNLSSYRTSSLRNVQFSYTFMFKPANNGRVINSVANELAEFRLPVTATKSSLLHLTARYSNTN